MPFLIFVKKHFLPPQGEKEQPYQKVQHSQAWVSIRGASSLSVLHYEYILGFFCLKCKSVQIYIKELKLKPRKNVKSLLLNTLLYTVLSAIQTALGPRYLLFFWMPVEISQCLKFHHPICFSAQSCGKITDWIQYLFSFFFQKNNFEIKKWNLNFHLFVFSSERLKVVLRVKQSKCYPHDIQMHQITHWLQDNISYTLTMCLHSAQPLDNHVCQRFLLFPYSCILHIWSRFSKLPGISQARLYVSLCCPLVNLRLMTSFHSFCMQSYCLALCANTLFQLKTCIYE